MGTFRFSISISADGFVAGPDQSAENPLGIGGEQLHEWAFGLAAWRKPHGLEGGEVNPSTPVVEETLANVGAFVMGRNMFGGGPGPWRPPKAGAVVRPGGVGSAGDASSPEGDEPWYGWWGDDPPFHVPVFVVTHHARDPLPMQGGTTFTFVTDGIEAALGQAKEAAAGKDVVLGGGANVAQQYLSARLLDEFTVSVVPVLLGGGERLLANVGDVRLEQVRAIEAPGVTHITYRVVK
jgi:dihydrofolate reductase